MKDQHENHGQPLAGDQLDLAPQPDDWRTRSLEILAVAEAEADAISGFNDARRHALYALHHTLNEEKNTLHGYLSGNNGPAYTEGVALLQKRIDEAQAKIDRYNAATAAAVPARRFQPGLFGGMRTIADKVGLFRAPVSPIFPV